MTHDTDTVPSAKIELPFLVDTKHYIDAPLRQSCDAKKNWQSTGRPRGYHLLVDAPKGGETKLFRRSLFHYTGLMPSH